MDEFEKARDEANVLICGVGPLQHDGFNKGADWAREWFFGSDRWRNVTQQNLIEALKRNKTQAKAIEKLMRALELVCAAYDNGDTMIEPGETNYIDAMDGYARDTLKEVKEMLGD